MESEEELRECFKKEECLLRQAITKFGNQVARKTFRLFEKELDDESIHNDD